MNNLLLNHLSLLPEETMRHDIFRQLNLGDIFNFGSCSSYFQKLTANNWRLIAHLKFPFIKNTEKQIGGEYEINYEQLAKRLFLLTRYVELIKQEKLNYCRNGSFVITEVRKKVNHRIYFDILIDTLKGNDEEIFKSLENREYFHSSVRDFLNTVCYLDEENELLKYLDFVYSIKIRRENALKETTKPTASNMEMSEWKLRYSKNSLNQNLQKYEKNDFTIILQVFIRYDDMQAVELILDYFKDINWSPKPTYEDIKSDEMERLLINKGIFKIHFLYNDFFL